MSENLAVPTHMRTTSMPPLVVLTLNTNQSMALDNWKLSLTQQGYGHVKILGLGKKWKGFVWKTEMYIKFLHRLHAQYGDDLIVMTCDSTDVMFLRSQGALLHTFRTMHQNIVVSADHTQLVGAFGNRTVRDITKKIIEKRLSAADATGSLTPYIWINSGLCMGYVKHMIALYEKIRLYEDDQEGVQMEWLADPTLCWVDNHQHLFATVSGMKHIGKLNSCKDSNLVLDPSSHTHIHTITRTHPCVIHFPGKITSTYNQFIQEWQQYMRDTHLTPTWHEGLQTVPSRHLGGLWAWKFYASTFLKAHKRETNIGATVMVTVIVAMLLWHALRRNKRT
jgi:hypothetical protein